MRVCDAGHPVGPARPRGEERDAKATRGVGVRVRVLDGGAFVADVDDRDAVVGETHLDGHDVAAAQPEDALHAARLEIVRDHGGR